MITAKEAYERCHLHSELKEIEKEIIVACDEGKGYASRVVLSELAKDKLYELGYEVVANHVEYVYDIIWG